MSRIAVVGCEASGKTVFMAALADQYRPDPDRPDRPCLVPENSAANGFGAFLRRQMRSLRVWPPATNPGRTVDMEWSFRRGGKILADVGMLEFGGETFRAAFRDGSAAAGNGAVESLMGHLGGCGFFIVLVSIKELLRDPGEMPIEEFERDTEAVWVTRGILEFVRTRVPGAGVVIGLTQADRYPDELERAGGAARLLARRWPTIAAIATDVPVVPVASVSATDENGNPAEGYVTDGIRPVTRELEKWLLARRRHSGRAARPATREPRPEAAPASAAKMPRTRDGGIFALLLVSAVFAGAGIWKFASSGPQVPAAEPTLPAVTSGTVETASTAAAVESPGADAAVEPAATNAVAEEVASVAETAAAVESPGADAAVEPVATNAVAEAAPPPRVLSREEQAFSNRYARAMSGDARCQRWLANQHYAGTQFAKRDLRRARELYRSAAAGGDVKAMAYYAAMAESGEGGDWDVPEALSWYRKAAEGGHADAMYRTGVACWNSRGGGQAFVREANEWFRKAKAANCSFPNVDAWIKKTAK